MAQTAMITPSKTSIWKRRRNKKKSSSSDYSSSSKAATGGSPTNVCRIAELRTNNGVAEAAVVTITVDNNDIGKDEAAAYVDSPAAAISKSNYTMQDNDHDDNPNIAYFPPQSAQQSSQGNSNYSAASYFNSILSGHRLSFSEDEESHANNDDNDGVIIQEVRQHSSFARADDLRKVDNTNDHDDVGEKWRPFGTDLNEDDVEKLGLSSSPNEVVNADNSPQQESSPNNNSNNFNNDAIITTPLTDPPTTQRKTLTPEFFLGSGSNNKNNLNIQKKKGTKRLDTSTTINDTTTAATSMKENHHHHNLSSSNISTTSSSDGGHMYAEIYLPTKAKKKPYPPPPSSTTMMGGVSRDRSTLSSHTIPSLAMTMVSSLSGRSSLFGAQENGCMPVVISPDQHNNNNDEMMMGGDVLGVTEYNYFDYDANAGAPLSPQGVSPQRELQNMFIPNIDRSRNSSHKANNDNNNHHWKSRVNSLWKSVSKHTCRCFGEPFSNEDERDKWKVSSATTAATSTTAANTSAAAAAAAVRKMNQTPMFSTPVKDNGIFD